MTKHEGNEFAARGVDDPAIEAGGARGRVGIVAPTGADFATQHAAVTLRFRDAQLEYAYLQGEYSRVRVWILGSLAFGLAMTLLFYPVDRMFIPPDELATVHAIRVFVMAVMCLIGILGVLAISQASVAIPFLAVCTAIYGLAWTAICVIAGTIDEPYVAFGVTQTILFAYVCLGLPFRWSAAVVALTLAPILVSSAAHGLFSEDFWRTTTSLAIIGLIATYGAFRHEWGARERFLTQHRFEAEYTRRLAIQSEQNGWLRIIAGFTRHELRNAMAGIGSSLELLERTGLPDSGPEYLRRAKYSLQLMRNVLQQVANATSLEGALQLQEVEEVDLSRLVAGRAEDFRRDAGDFHYEVNVADGVRVRGNPDSLVQMLDKLMNNAIEHSEPGGKIDVALDTTPGYARLTVTDHGEPLPLDLEAMFHPFVSIRRPDREGNLGLGLYVAKMIAGRHGGTISAEPTADRPGARFIVALPLLGQ